MSTFDILQNLAYIRKSKLFDDRENVELVLIPHAAKEYSGFCALTALASIKNPDTVDYFYILSTKHSEGETCTVGKRPKIWRKLQPGLKPCSEKIKQSEHSVHNTAELL